MNVKQVVGLSGALAVLVMLTIGVADGMGCDMGSGGSGSRDRGAAAMATPPARAGHCAMADTASAEGCPMMNRDARMTVKDVPGGVQIELTGTDSATIAAIRSQARQMLAMHNSASIADDGRGRSGEERPSPARVQTPAYTCPMHPEVVSTTPGNCPKCGMTLAPVRR